MADTELIDIGVNLTSKQLCSDIPSVIARARNAGVTHIICTGSSVACSTTATSIAKAHPDFVTATAGVHPHNAASCDDDTINTLRRLATLNEVVAVGECGLDYNRDFSPRDVQRRWFEAQLQLAIELRLPVFLHERDAHADFAAILRSHRDALVGGVVHCFTGTGAELDIYLEMDLHIGITGWICDERRGSHLRTLVPRIPGNRLMIETDAPYLLPRNMPSPAGERKPRYNEPRFLPHVLAAVAAAAKRPSATVATQTSATARALFALA